jgi:actin-related protein
MYCGDETGSFIGEIGSHTCRFGYGGEDNPKLVLPSYTVVHSSDHTRRMGVSSLHNLKQEEHMESILRMASSSDSDTMDIAKIQPQTDPNAFLQQGDSIEHWDNLQTAWETSMETLRATDTMKHTQGGNPYTFPKKIKHSHGGVTSTTVPASATSDGKCIHPILAITPGMTHYAGHGKAYHSAHKRQQYVQYTELIMESLDAKSMFLAPAPMLAAFSLGRQTALMVDLGAGGCRVTPVVDGLVLQHSQRRNGRGGEWLGNVTWKALLEEYDPPLALKPRCLLRDVGRNTTNVRSLVYRRAMSDLMYEVRTEPFVHLEEMDSDNIRVPFLPSSTKNGINPPSPSTPGTLGSTHTANSTDATYRLPDGTTVDLSSNFGKDLRQLPELLFAETLPFADESSSSSSSSTTDFLPTFSTAPLHKLVQESLLAVADVDVRKDLAGSICLTGGTSLLPHVETRLSQELSNMLPAFVKPKVVASRFSVERSCASWIGGSILTSLGSFQQLWLSRAEYEEYGAVLAIQRFP